MGIGTAKKLAVLGMALMCLYLLFMGQLRKTAETAVEAGRMKNVEIVVPSAAPVPEETPAEASPETDSAAEADAGTISLRLPEESEAPLSQPADNRNLEQIQETTISGGLSIKNETSYDIDVSGMLLDGSQVRLPNGEPQILIIHTHSSEAYTPAGLDRYEASDTNRTEDKEYNIVRVGDELTALLQQAGLNVIHDREIYDYPSYTGSYERSGAAVQSYLEQYPSIAVVIDMHRDALGANGVVYKTMAEESGVCASQVMLLVGTDDSGLTHPNWRSNLSLALYLQNAVSAVHPTLMRPVALVQQRYNQHLTGGSLILEVGSSGNTLQEALAAIRLFADAAAPALLALVEEV
ncbi:MAG: stage II sporulation protein P [Oscillospiraceae bacterium]